MYSAVQAANPDSPVLMEIGDIPGWRTVPNGTGLVPHFELPSNSVNASLQRGHEIAQLYVAYYRGQNDQRKLVNSDNVLIQSEDKAWLKLGERQIALVLGNQTVEAIETRMRAAADGRAFVAWRWYWIDGTLTSSDALAKARIGWSKMLQRGDDSAVVILYAEERGGQDASETLRAFVADAWPSIAASLARAKARR
jgi:EpsI family protein